MMVAAEGKPLTKIRAIGNDIFGDFLVPARNLIIRLFTVSVRFAYFIKAPPDDKQSITISLRYDLLDSYIAFN